VPAVVRKRVGYGQRVGCRHLRPRRDNTQKDDDYCDIPVHDGIKLKSNYAKCKNSKKEVEREVLGVKKTY
jgi:hypothetical protein